MVDNVSYEYMCFFLAGGLRTSEGNFLLHWRVACGLVEAGVHVERRRSGLQLQLPSGLKVYGACVLRGVYLSCDRKFGEKLQCSFMVYSRFCSQSKGRCFFCTEILFSSFQSCCVWHFDQFCFRNFSQQGLAWGGWIEKISVLGRGVAVMWGEGLLAKGFPVTRITGTSCLKVFLFWPCDRMFKMKWFERKVLMWFGEGFSYVWNIKVDLFSSQADLFWCAA